MLPALEKSRGVPSLHSLEVSDKVGLIANRALLADAPSQGRVRHSLRLPALYSRHRKGLNTRQHIAAE